MYDSKFFFFLMLRRPPRSTQSRSSAASDVYKRQVAKWWIPDDVVFIDEVPKTSVGKFSKKTLREQFADYELPGVADA